MTGSDASGNSHRQGLSHGHHNGPRHPAPSEASSSRSYGRSSGRSDAASTVQSYFGSASAIRSKRHRGAHSSWHQLMKDAPDAAKVDRSLIRQVAVPILTGFVVAIVLTLLHPPFVSARDGDDTLPRVSYTAVVVWSIVAAIATALLTHSNVFKYHTNPFRN